MKKQYFINANIIDPFNSLNENGGLIVGEDGKIEAIGKKVNTNNLPTREKPIDLKGKYIFPGLVDMRVFVGEPGYEYKENFRTLSNAALSGGVTSVVTMPNTDPIIDSHADVSHLKKSASHHTTALHISSVLSHGGEGKQMASLYDLQKAGAVAFGDYKKAYANPNLLRIALDYSQSFDGLIQAYPMDDSLGNKGHMNEGLISTNLGLKGIPNVAETATLARDLQLLEYTKGKMHIPFISCATSVELIRAAKKKGLNLSCGVGIPHLIYTEENLLEFNSDFKIVPPLRTSIDQRALREGLLDGTIDMVSSMHQPVNPELKNLEFVNAQDGSIGLEAAFVVLQNYFPLEKVISFLTRGKARFNIINTPFELGSKVDFSLFNPGGSSVFSKEHIHSTSKNCMYIGTPIKGSVYGCIRGSHFQLNS